MKTGARTAGNDRRYRRFQAFGSRREESPAGAFSLDNTGANGCPSLALSASPCVARPRRGFAKQGRARTEVPRFLPLPARRDTQDECASSFALRATEDRSDFALPSSLFELRRTGRATPDRSGSDRAGRARTRLRWNPYYGLRRDRSGSGSDRAGWTGDCGCDGRGFHASN